MDRISENTTTSRCAANVILACCAVILLMEPGSVVAAEPDELTIRSVGLVVSPLLTDTDRPLAEGGAGLVFTSIHESLNMTFEVMGYDLDHSHLDDIFARVGFRAGVVADFRLLGDRTKGHSALIGFGVLMDSHASDGFGGAFQLPLQLLYSYVGELFTFQVGPRVLWGTLHHSNSNFHFYLAGRVLIRI